VKTVDLFRPFVAPEARDAVATVLTPDPATGRLYIGQGARVDAFETALRRALRSPTPVLTLNSCTSALDLALHLCGVGGAWHAKPSSVLRHDDLVITTPMTCSATNSPIVTRGGRILWADVDPLTGLISPASVDDRIDYAITRLGTIPSAIMAVDWGGHLVEYPTLRRVASQAQAPIPVIQDAAHSFGTTVGGRSFLDPAARADDEVWRGDFVCFSFQAIKALTTGDGGALVCPDVATTERAKLLRWYGLDRESSADFRCAQQIEEVGYKFHLNDIAAAIGLANLPHVEFIIHRQRTHANAYGTALAGLDGVILPPPFRTPKAVDEDGAWWLFTLLVADRDAFIRFLAERGIAASPVHARNDHHPGFRAAAMTEVPLPGVDFFAAHEVAIPVGWWLTSEDQARVIEAVWAWARGHGRPLDLPRGGSR
jgi:dTDP-4-amino-4,6-dideoxygalactose transaminase